MAQPYNKPGVYIEDSLSPTVPVVNTATPSTAAFIGYADRGPTTLVGNNVVAVPTLVSSWSDFINTFSFGSNVNTWTGIPQITLLPTAGNSTIAISNSTTNVTVKDTTGLYVGSVLTLVGAAGAALSTISPTVVAAIVDSTTIKLNQAPVSTGTATSITASNNKDLKYAVKTFFDNGGSQAYIVRDVSPSAVKASTTIRDSNLSTSLSGSLSFDASATNFGNKVVTITSASAVFTAFSAGNTASISGVTDSDYVGLNGKTWVVSSVSSDKKTLSLYYSPAAAVATSTTTYSSGNPVVLTGGGQSPTDALKISAKDHGVWGNSVWVGITPNSTPGFFDLTVYFSNSVSTSDSLKDANVVERFLQLSMDPANSRYFLNQVSSLWIDVADQGSIGSGVYRLPAFTGTWGNTSDSKAVSGTNGSFSWNTGGFTNTPVAVKIGAVTSAASQSSATAGSSGSTVRDRAVLVPRLDSVTTPLIINWANNSYTLDINQLISYASGRKDSFVVIDAEYSATLDDVLSTKQDIGIASYTGNVDYAAAYYPNIAIADPASTTGNTVFVAPGGAVAALYTDTDSRRGVFKAPAGVDARIKSAVNVIPLSNTDFTSVNSYSSNLNIIRYVPGSGFCVMGARTLSTDFTLRYIPTRRTISYVGSALKDLTQFAVFAPNNQALWNTVSGVVSKFLTDFWRNGGLVGNTASQAFYVKCDSSNNTPGSIGSGELHVEVGIATQKPAEFVIIRIGQLDGSSTVTASI